ncbi:MAG: signal peptidase II [Clostridiales bacterium]|nr:signal peptidase II [Clostridiales bacterium]
MIILLIIGIILIVVDQILKNVAIMGLADAQTIEFFFVNLKFVPKYATIFGKDFNVIYIIISIVIAAIFAFWFLTQFAQRVKNKNNYIPFILVLFGLISNIIDRIIRGYVITYMSIPLLLQDISFNLADICIAVGLFLTVVFYLLKVNNDAFNRMDLNSIEKKGKKKWFWK